MTINHISCCRYHFRASYSIMLCSTLISSLGMHIITSLFHGLFQLP